MHVSMQHDITAEHSLEVLARLRADQRDSRQPDDVDICMMTWAIAQFSESA